MWPTPMFYYVNPPMVPSSGRMFPCPGPPPAMLPHPPFGMPEGDAMDVVEEPVSVTNTEDVNLEDGDSKQVSDILLFYPLLESGD